MGKVSENDELIGMLGERIDALTKERDYFMMEHNYAKGFGDGMAHQKSNDALNISPRLLAAGVRLRHLATKFPDGYDQAKEAISAWDAAISAHRDAAIGEAGRAALQEDK